jgi:hypothetical protein
MNGRWTDSKVPLQVSFGGRPSEHVGVSIDEGQILSLFGGKVWRSRLRRHRASIGLVGLEPGTAGVHYRANWRKSMIFVLLKGIADRQQ